jgi:hypothetical protein
MTVALAGCSGSAAENDERLVRSYIASLNSGDIANAMMLRCPLAQVEESKRQLFAEQVDRLRIAAGGSLDVATLERVKKPNLDDFSGHRAQREIRYKLKSDGKSVGWVHLAITDDKICGELIEESIATRDTLAANRIVSSGRTLANLRIGSGIANGLNLNITSDRVDSLKSTYGATPTDGWDTAWRTGTYGGGRVTALRFANKAEAEDVAQHAVMEDALDSGELFDVPDEPRAVGIRVQAVAWTFAQPYGLGDTCDHVFVVLGDTMLSIGQCALDPATNHDQVLSIAASLFADLGPSP